MTETDFGVLDLSSFPKWLETLDGSMNFSFSQPGGVKRVVFGRGMAEKVPSLLPKDGNVMVICGGHSAERIKNSLIPALGGRRCTVCSQVPPELPLEAVETLRRRAEAEGVKVFIGWGGGSSLDAAKAAAALCGNPGTAADYFYGRAKLERRGTFLLEVPTTAGTGAELTGNAVICDTETGIKQSLRGSGMLADAAVCDASLLAGSPLRVLAASGFDAVTQALESYLSLKSDPVRRRIALLAARRMLAALSKACAGNAAAQGDMALGSMLTAVAFAATGLGAAHGVGHPAGSVLKLPHGVVCAVLLPEVLRWNSRVKGERVTELALALGFDGASALIAALEKLRSSLELPDKLPALTAEQTGFIVKNCRSGSMKSNPYQMTDDEVRTFLLAVSR